MIAMDKCLATVQHLEEIAVHDGVNIEVWFDVDKEEFYKIAAQQGLEVHSDLCLPTATHAAYWRPLGEDNNSLEVSFYTFIV